MSNFTKGPWIVDLDGTEVVAVFSTKKEMRICGLRGSDYLIGSSDKEVIDMRTANGYLIAAAPDMYETLKALLDARGPCECDGCNRLKAVLAKVDGE